MTPDDVKRIFGMSDEPATGPPKLALTARATIKRVLDGDTVEVEVRWPATIRLKDCWAPEVTKDYFGDGLAAKRHAQNLCPPGSDVIVSINSEEADSLGDLMTFGRVVADVRPLLMEECEITDYLPTG